MQATVFLKSGNPSNQTRFDAKGILDVAKSYEHMRTLAENGYKRVEAYYRECDFLNNYRNLYMEVKE